MSRFLFFVVVVLLSVVLPLSVVQVQFQETEREMFQLDNIIIILHIVIIYRYETANINQY